MMCVEFMKNFPLADSCELMAVRLIPASWAQKRLIPTFLTWCTSSSWKIFFSPIPASWWLLDSFRPSEAKNVWFLLSRHDVRRVHEKFFSCRFERAHGCSSHFGLLSPKTFDSYFLDMMYVEFMKIFLLADSSELMAVRLISATWAQKRLFSTFYTWCTLSWSKILLPPIRASRSLLDSFRPPDIISASWAQKRLIPPFYTWCTLNSWKIFFSQTRASWWLLDSFRPPEPKTVWFLLSRHDMRRVHEKFSSCRFVRAHGC